MQIKSAKELIVYKKGYELAMRIFNLTKKFPADEKFALTSQIRRSSRSICLNLRSAWAVRRYEAHFINQLLECAGENSKTEPSLDIALDQNYITLEQHTELVLLCVEVDKLLASMLKNTSYFLISDPRAPTSALASDP